MRLSKIISDAVDNASYKTANGMIDLTDPYHYYLVVESLKEYLDPDVIEAALFGEKEDEDEYVHKWRDQWVKKGDEDKEGAQRYRKDGDKFIPITADDDGEEKKDVNIFDDPPAAKPEAEVTLDFSKNQKYNTKLSDGLQTEAEYMEFESDADKLAFLEAAKKLGDDPNSLTKDDIDIINNLFFIKLSYEKCLSLTDIKKIINL